MKDKKMTKALYLAAASLFLAAPALAVNDNSIVGNSGVSNQGNISNSTINNGGAGSFSPVSTSTATGGTAIAGGGNATALQGQTQSATSGVSGSGNSSVSIRDRKQAPAVFAPGLANGYDCNGSASFGGSIAGFGIGGGSTVVSEVCESVFLSRELERKGDKDASWGVLCEIDRVRKHSSKCPVRDEDVEAVEHGEYPAGGSVNDRRYR